MKKNGFMKRALALTLSAVMGLSMAACGENTSNEGESQSGSAGSTGTAKAEYVYVPEYLDALSAVEGENSWRGQMNIIGDRLYYTMTEYDVQTGIAESKLCYRAITDLATETEVMIPELTIEEGYSSSMGDFFFDAENNLYVYYYVSPIYVEGEEYDYNDNTTYLAKFDSSMNQVYVQDLKDMFQDEDNSYIQYSVIGKSGKVYASSNDVIYVIGADGKFQKSIPTQSDWINAMFATDDGRVFFTRYSMTSSGMDMVEINTETDSVGDTFKNLPDMNVQAKGGKDDKLFVKGDTGLYEYDLNTQESTLLLKWLDCNMTGDYVQEFTMLEDGNVLVYYDNYEGDEELVKLVKTERSQVQEKEIITLATLYSSNQSLEQAIVAFNKASDKYKIELKVYIDDNAEWTETTYDDAVNLMNADLTGSNVPDLIDLSSVDMSNLVSKGVLEDLVPYLEKSTVLSKDDFVPNVLNAYTLQDKLITIPKNFTLSTLLAKTSIVGEKQGWTIDEVMELAKQYPDAKLMQYVDKSTALQICLMYSSDSFIDYVSGTCRFNSPEFKKVLEFANSFAAEYTYNEEESLPEMIQNDKILLNEVSVGEMTEYQMYSLMFEEDATCIGFPTVDGGSGVLMSGSEIYGIHTKSAHKEGAWAFLESFLGYTENNRYAWGLSSRVDMLEESFAEAMEPNYLYDENGNIMYDENGVPMQTPKTTWGYNNWEAEIYAATQEQVDEVKDMIAVAKPLQIGDTTVYELILEESESYFAGQKSVDEVAAIIQSRVEIYVSENS